MKTTLLLLLLILLIALGVFASAQSLPKVWNRAADWDAKQNPCKDSKGNAVWHHHHRKGCCQGGLSQTWSTTWGGWVYKDSSSYYTNADPIIATHLIDYSRYDLWKRYHSITPEVYFKNTTGQSFLVAIEGKISLYWTGNGGVAHNTPVVVLITYRDNSTGKVTTLLSRTVAKPTANNKAEGTNFIVKIPTLRMDPNDWIMVQGSCKTSSGSESYVMIGDKSLDFLRMSIALATETVRNATPKNPLTLNKGRTSRPLIGKTWDPYISDSPTNGLTDLLAVGFVKIHAGSKFGTFLTQPVAILTAKPRASFLIPLPNNPVLAGYQVATQGASMTSSGGLLLTNALDVQIGDF